MSTDKDGRTPLFYAVITDDIDNVILLLKNDIDLNLQDNQGWSALHVAAQYYRVEIAKILIENGIELELKDKHGNTPLWRAVFASDGKGDLIKLLLKKGADPNNKNYSGISPFNLASKIANYDNKKFF